jgi:hypothetical protein
VPTKPKVARLYLNQEAQELLSKSSAAIGDLSESQIMSLLVLAALRALQQENFRMEMPLRLSVVKEQSSLLVPVDLLAEDNPQKKWAPRTASREPNECPETGNRSQGQRITPQL